MRKLISAVCLVLMVISVTQIANDFYQRENENKLFETIAQEVKAVQPRDIEEVDLGPDANGNGIMDIYENLLDLNEDLVGWIHINDTNINYPVMMTPSNPEYYLRRDFEKNTSTSGVPFIGMGCDINPQTNNVIIYGHNMRNGTMFSDLTSYLNKSFYEEHKTVSFSTLSEEQEYEILAVFVIDTSIGNGHFDFYNFTDMNETKFETYVDTAKSLSRYETNIDATFGDRLITLVTCEKTSSTNGRLVVIAVEK